MGKRYKLIEVPESCCKNKEYHMAEYHDGYSDCHIICKISNEVCNEENCNHKELQLDGFTKEEMIEKMANAMLICKDKLNKDYLFHYGLLAEAALNALLENK